MNRGGLANFRKPCMLNLWGFAWVLECQPLRIFTLAFSNHSFGKPYIQGYSGFYFCQSPGPQLRGWGFFFGHKKAPSVWGLSCDAGSYFLDAAFFAGAFFAAFFAGVAFAVAPAINRLSAVTPFLGTLAASLAFVSLCVFGITSSFGRCLGRYVFEDGLNKPFDELGPALLREDGLAFWLLQKSFDRLQPSYLAG